LMVCHRVGISFVSNFGCGSEGAYAWTSPQQTNIIIKAKEVFIGMKNGFKSRPV
jgi:hypothetical protein